MIYIVLENNVVTNRIVADENTDIADNWILYDELLHGTVNAGYLYDGLAFTAPPPDPVAEGIQVRHQRDALLSQSDIYVYPDRWARMTAEQQIAWGNYRQALRDIPLQSGFPFNIVWPQIPE